MQSLFLQGGPTRISPPELLLTRQGFCGGRGSLEDLLRQTQATKLQKYLSHKRECAKTNSHVPNSIESQSKRERLSEDPSTYTPQKVTTSVRFSRLPATQAGRLSADRLMLDRMKLFRLAWELVGSEFAGRQQQYEKFYAGASFIVRNYSHMLAPWDDLHAIVDGLMASYDAPKEATAVSSPEASRLG